MFENNNKESITIENNLGSAVTKYEVRQHSTTIAVTIIIIIIIVYIFYKISKYFKTYVQKRINRIQNI